MKGKNILLVDDAEKITSLLKLMLLNNSRIKTITTASALSEAEMIVQKQETDVVILDIGFKEGNGIEFLKWIKERYPAISVILFTIHSDEWHRDLARQAGADHFLDKYTQFEEIPEIVARLS